MVPYHSNYINTAHHHSLRHGQTEMCDRFWSEAQRSDSQIFLRSQYDCFAVVKKLFLSTVPYGSSDEM